MAASVYSFTLPSGKILINNQWLEAESGRTFATVNPTTGMELARVAEGSAVDVNRAVAAARSAFEIGPWRRCQAADRGKLLYKLADLIEQHAEELARLEALDGGKPVADSRAVDLPLAIACYRYYAGWADKIQGQVIPIPGNFFCYFVHEPIGVIGAIIPWNFPLLMQAWKLAPALAAGNTVVLKPAEQTPLSALRVGELILQAGFPRGVVNIVTGFGPCAGAAVAHHMDVDKIAFTGSTATGRLVMQAAALSNLKGVTLELGGKSPNVVFADADVDSAVEGTHLGVFFNQGQCCCAGSRVFVEDKCYDEFVEKCVARARKRIMGDPCDRATDHGPLIDQTQLETVVAYIESGRREGAELLCGGDRVAGPGYFLAPTVFANVTDEMTIAREEIFGPVMSIIRFKGIYELIERANATRYGLAAAVWTRDISKAHRIACSVRAGTVWINCYNVFSAAAPFGGFKQSGIGRELGHYGLQQYTETKTVTMRI